MTKATGSGIWDRRALESDLHAVFTRRWSDEDCRVVHDTQSEAMTRLLDPVPGELILDLGCGIGRLTGTLLRRTTAVVGVDISLNMVRRARTAVPQARLVCASATALPLRSGAFDAVCASFVFQHLLDDDSFYAALAECRRVLKPSGRIAMMEGVGETAHVPPNSTTTVVRTLDQFRAGLAPDAQLAARDDHVFIEDRYVSLLWRFPGRQGQPR
jgi:SAM-dependent methyltransferase